VNQALREAVLSLQRQCEEQGKVERELRQTCENLRRLVIEKTSQLQQEIEKRKAVEEILRRETKAVFYMLRRGYLADAVEQVGSSYVSTKRRLLKRIGIDA